MKKLLINLKPFLIFQICFVLTSLVLLWLGPDSAITTIISCIFLFPIISGGVYVLGFLFGFWIEFRNQKGISFLFLITLISLIINCIAWLPQYSNTAFLFPIAFQETVGFFVGQLVMFLLKLIVKQRYMNK